MNREAYKALLDAEVERLKDASDQTITEAWVSGELLFAFVSPSEEKDSAECGCLTMIRRRKDRFAVTLNGKRDLKLTGMIRRADDLPRCADEGGIRKALPAFAAWQLRIRDYWMEKGWISDYGEGLEVD